MDDLINDTQLIHLLDETLKVVNKLNEYLSSKIKKLNRFIPKKKKEKPLGEAIPYADFKINDKLIIKTKEDERLKLDFNQLITDKDIQPREASKEDRV